MTNEDVERAIDFLLKSQANSEARIEQTNGQLNRMAEGLAELRVQMEAYADTQRELMRVFTNSLEEGERFRESQKRINESQMRLIELLAAKQTRSEESHAEISESLRTSIGELTAKQTKTEEALARLAVAQESSERRLEALTKIIEEERGR